MFSKEHKIAQKLFVISTYKKRSQIEVVLKNIAQKNNIQLQLSILGSLTSDKTNAKKEQEKIIADKKQQLSNLLGKEFEFGYFNNPEIGSLFIAGHLTPTFLTKVDERELASLPAGLSGIFRGLGIKKEDINDYLTAIKNGNYCLIIRVESTFLSTLKSYLKAI
ncbi:hypothetical protein [Polaribacter glomeratus]|uniref:Uncharacterized protein n=1 Tax=Polaribacter glomeratus TaxID=102 RepID=A0A2S7WFS9_9FLAO|nr:hypothetical protein [Polaribacter glomeratus]PQJ76276.1 hypothetical protein BTO16_10155 [Polaribacter glomeratus]TXD63808.1 hypothetical protein ESX12_16940 [Polaribacter glomeratus]